MYLNKEDAINLANASRNVIATLQQWIPDNDDLVQDREQINIDIVSLEYQLEKLDKAIEDSPTQ